MLVLKSVDFGELFFFWKHIKPESLFDFHVPFKADLQKGIYFSWEETNMEDTDSTRNIV